jgi:hypothetical protein
MGRQVRYLLAILAIVPSLLLVEMGGNWLINDPCLWSCERMSDEERDRIIDNAIDDVDPDGIVDDAIRDAR